MNQGQGQDKRNQRPGGRREQQSRTGDPDLKERLVGINRVAKTTKGGRTFSFSAIVVVGDEKGKIGHGLGKSREVATAIPITSPLPTTAPDPFLIRSGSLVSKSIAISLCFDRSGNSVGCNHSV